ncbi:hypothetical protein [Ralstonia pseudosolanacearum]
MRGLKVIAIIPCLLVGFGCKERVPDENTPAFYALHGIVNDGKTVNEITLINDENNNHPKLRFLPGVFVSVNTPGTHDSRPVPIKKGFAYSAGVWLDLNEVPELRRVVEKGRSNSINITFHASLGRENVRDVEKRLKDVERFSIRTTDKADWNLREYVLVTPGTDRLSAYEYVPMGGDFRSIDGVRMWIGCQAAGSVAQLANLSNDRVLYGCASHFNYKNGLSLTYHFDQRLLPYWRLVYDGVISFVDSVVVE